MNVLDNLSRRDASLYQFWDRARKLRAGVSVPVIAEDWNNQIRFLSASGIGTEEALNYLLVETPVFEEFLEWIRLTYVPGDRELAEPIGQVLTGEDHKFWDEHGYLVIKNAVPQTQCADARTAIWNFLGADPLVADSWYGAHPAKKGLMLEFFQHAALDANRNSARIKQAYRELYKSTEIYMLVDKVSFNPPEHQQYKFMGSPLHWDVSLRCPIPFVLQGLLYLNDVDEKDGAFRCVPGFHNCIDKWLASLPENVDPRSAALTDLKPVSVPGNAGDLIVWHQALPHCAAANHGKTPRMVQYIAYKPMKANESTTWV